MGPSLMPEPYGEGILIAVCHPDIVVPTLGGKKNPFYVYTRNLTAWHSVANNDNAYNGGINGTNYEGEANWKTYMYKARVEFCSDVNFDGICVAVFVNTLDDLKDLYQNNFDFYISPDAEFKKSLLTNGNGTWDYSPEPKKGYYSSIKFVQAEIPYRYTETEYHT